MTAQTAAEAVLAEHGFAQTDGRYHCACGERFPQDYRFVQAHASHQVAALVAAGLLTDPAATDTTAAALARVSDLADGWQAEVEDDGDGLTHLETVLEEIRAALSGADHHVNPYRAIRDTADPEESSP